MGSNPILSATLRPYGLRVAGHEVGLTHETVRPQECLPKLCQERRETGRPMWYVYFLELNNDDIYVGSTPDLRRRYKSHHDGQVQSTKAFRPIKLRSYVAVETETKAGELERYFKSGSGKAIALKRLL